LPLHMDVLILPKFMESRDFTLIRNLGKKNFTFCFLSTVGIFVS
jgi:hypothetical protein